MHEILFNMILGRQGSDQGIAERRQHREEDHVPTWVLGGCDGWRGRSCGRVGIPGVDSLEGTASWAAAAKMDPGGGSVQEIVLCASMPWHGNEVEFCGRWVGQPRG